MIIDVLDAALAIFLYPKLHGLKIVRSFCSSNSVRIPSERPQSYQLKLMKSPKTMKSAKEQSCRSGARPAGAQSGYQKLQEEKSRLEKENRRLKRELLKAQTSLKDETEKAKKLAGWRTVNTAWKEKIINWRYYMAGTASQERLLPGLRQPESVMVWPALLGWESCWQFVTMLHCNNVVSLGLNSLTFSECYSGTCNLVLLVVCHSGYWAGANAQLGGSSCEAAFVFCSLSSQLGGPWEPFLILAILMWAQCNNWATSVVDRIWESWAWTLMEKKWTAIQHPCYKDVELLCMNGSSIEM